MTCSQARETVLERLAVALSHDEQARLEAHLSACAECAAFAVAQRTLDSRMAAAVTAPRLPAKFRTSLRASIRSEASSWPDFWPDVAHVVGCCIGVTALVL